LRTTHAVETALPRPIIRFLAGHSVLQVALIPLIAFVSVALALVLVATDGNPFVGVLLLGILAIAVATVYRADWGFYIFLFFVLFFDQYDIPGFPSFTTSVEYFLNLNAIGWLPHIEQGVVTPMELQLLFLGAVWFLTCVLRGSFDLTAVPRKGTTVLMYLAIIASMVRGLLGGGSFIIILWETRALFYMALMILFVPQVIKTEEQVRGVMWVAIAGISFKAFQGAWRYASLGFSFGQWPHIYETLTNHEDPVFTITLWVLLLGFVLFGVRGRQRKAMMWLMIPLLLGYVAAQRRAAYASLMATLAAFIMLLPAKQRRRFLTTVGIFAIFFGVYLGAFWEGYSRLGSVAQQFKATVTDEPGIRGDKDVKSTLYRKIENYNLGQTFQRAPISGIGFGRPYDKVMTLWGSGFALGDYVAHNQILWVFVQMGGGGACLFLLLFIYCVLRGAMVFQKMTDPYLKAVCAMCLVAVFNQIVVSYVDMQLTYYRNMVYLGVLIGLMPVLANLQEHSSKSQEAERAEA
jgi:hypothetical protein